MKIMFYLTIISLLFTCTKGQKALPTSETCEAPRKEIAQSAPVNTLFCRHSKNLKLNMDTSSLWLAVLNKDITWVKYEVERGADVNLGDSLVDESPLYGAVTDDSKNIVAYLLEHGADPNKPRSDNGKTKASNGSNPLTFAADKNIEIVKLLLEHGADPNKPRSSNGLTTTSDGSAPLLLAADADETEIVRLLLEYGADPNQKNADNGLTNFSQGGTALVMAIIVNNAEMVRLLLEHGADPNVEIKLLQDKGITLLDYARIYASRKIVDMLEKQGLTKSTTKGSLLCMPRTPFWSKCW